MSRSAPDWRCGTSAALRKRRRNARSFRPALLRALRGRERFPPVRPWRWLSLDAVKPKSAGKESLLAGIVRGVDISDGERALAVDLQHGGPRGPGIMVHLGRGLRVASGGEPNSLLFVKLVAHADVEFSRDH